jgi:uncharacterized membrane protein YecN with MAPEG domain
MIVSISAMYAAILGALFVPFTAYVGTYRVKNKLLLRDGGDVELSRRIRAHANFTETVPMALILLVLVELSGGSASLLHSLGAVLVTARVMHYVTIATNPGNTAPRALGMVGTLGVIAVSAGYLLIA